MFHEMRRKERLLSEEETLEILEKGEYGILSTVGEDGYPYGTPVNYVYKEGKIYFHGVADAGHRSENLKFSNQASFTVVGDTQLIPEKFGTKFESVIAFGTIHPVEDKFAALKAILEKYSSDYMESGMRYIEKSGPKTGVFELRIEHMTGKARRK